MSLNPFESSQDSIPVPTHLEGWLTQTKKLYIGGEFSNNTTGDTFTTYHPATHQSLSQVTIAGKKEVDAAVQSAHRAFTQGAWSRMPLVERAEKLRAIGNLIEKHKVDLAILESLDTGKPIKETYEGDIARVSSNFHFYADYACQLQSDHFETPTAKHEVLREPLGVCALITPWNLPLYLASWKIAPALVMGNSVVLKPSELTPLTAAFFTELIEQVELPPGVFNLVHGFGEASTGQFLCEHPKVDAISFTGETSTGKSIMKAASQNLTKVSFELGGKGANIIFKDADLNQVIKTTLASSFRNQGQICLALPRIFVEEPLTNSFLEKFVAETKKINIGHPLNFDTQMGSLISKEHRHKVMEYLRLLDPSNVKCGGTIPSHLKEGAFLNPTIVTGISDKHPISQEEVFGPVVSVYPFNSEEEVIERVNATKYGLSASIWTEDLNRAQRVSRSLNKGLVWINTWFLRDLRVPFGGQKQSGLGREGGKYSLDFFSDYKSIGTRYSNSTF